MTHTQSSHHECDLCFNGLMIHVELANSHILADIYPPSNAIKDSNISMLREAQKSIKIMINLHEIYIQYCTFEIMQ